MYPIRNVTQLLVIRLDYQTVVDIWSVGDSELLQKHFVKGGLDALLWHGDFIYYNHVFFSDTGCSENTASVWTATTLRTWACWAGISVEPLSLTTLHRPLATRYCHWASSIFVSDCNEKYRNICAFVLLWNCAYQKYGHSNPKVDFCNFTKNLCWCLTFYYYFYFIFH